MIPKSRAICGLPHHLANTPAEVLAEIFLQYLNIYRHTGQHYDWLCITHVCRFWRHVALNTPELWRRIIVVGPECVKTMVKRSKSASLYVEVSCHIGETVFPDFRRESLRLLAPELGRIHSLEFRGPFTRYEEFTNRFRDNTTLRTLRLVGYQYRFEDGIFTSGLRHLTVDGLSSDATSSTYLAMIDALENMPSLETLCLKDCIHRPSAGVIATLEGRVVSLPNLAYLCLENNDPETTAYILSHLYFPLNASLSIRSSATFHQVSPMVQAISEKLATIHRNTLPILANSPLFGPQHERYSIHIDYSAGQPSYTVSIDQADGRSNPT